MFESFPRISDLDNLNSDERCDLCEFLFQKMKYRNHHLIVENKNLRNKMKTMENEMQDIKDALNLEEFQCSLLTENLHSKLKEGRQYRIREEKLYNEIELLQSKLSEEALRISLLEERLSETTLEKTPSKTRNQRLCHVFGRLRRALKRKRNSVEDGKQDL